MTWTLLFLIATTPAQFASIEGFKSAAECEQYARRLAKTTTMSEYAWTGVRQGTLKRERSLEAQLKATAPSAPRVDTRVVREAKCVKVD